MRNDKIHAVLNAYRACARVSAGDRHNRSGTTLIVAAITTVVLHALVVVPVASAQQSFNIGQQVRVSNQCGLGLRVRTGPGTGFSILRINPEGTVLTILGGPVISDNLRWWNIQDAQGSGWSGVAEWLSPQPAVGLTVTVTADAENLRLRSAPGGSESIVARMPAGTQMSVIGGPICADAGEPINDNWWWQLSGAVGTGWSTVGYWLLPVSTGCSSGSDLCHGQCIPHDCGAGSQYALCCPTTDSAARFCCLLDQLCTAGGGCCGNELLEQGSDEVCDPPGIRGAFCSSGTVCNATCSACVSTGDDDGDGVSNDKDQCPNTIGPWADSNGCSCDQKSCDDGNPCTGDRCFDDFGSACDYFNNADPCSDGDECTVGDYCSGGICVPGVLPCGNGLIELGCEACDSSANPSGCGDHQKCSINCAMCVTVDSDGDGVPDDGDDCLGTPWSAVVDANGCSCEQKDCEDGDPCNGIEMCDPTSASCSAPSEEKRCKYVAIGDSTTTGFSVQTCYVDRKSSPHGCKGLPPVTPYPDRIASNGDPRFETVDRVGIWGYTAREAVDAALNESNGPDQPWKPQLLAAQEATSLVTVSFGANDIDFNSYKWVPPCISPFLPHVNPDACANRARDQAEGARGSIASMMDYLQTVKMNGAKVIVVLYYNPFNDHKKYGPGKILTRDCRALHLAAEIVVGALNRVLAEEAVKRGFATVDLRPTFRSHGAGSQESYVFGTECDVVSLLGALDADIDLGWPPTFEVRDPTLEEIAGRLDPHPNALGADAQAREILKAVNQ